MNKNGENDNFQQHRNRTTETEKGKGLICIWGAKCQYFTENPIKIEKLINIFGKVGMGLKPPIPLPLVREPWENVYLQIFTKKKNVMSGLSFVTELAVNFAKLCSIRNENGQNQLTRAVDRAVL